jgi:Lon protease-like protein
VRRLPLFPLPVVLIPGMVMPLHIFEPRYQQMVARCLEYDRRFGILYHDPDQMGPFQMEPGRIGTVAEIGEFRMLQDGRSLLLAMGQERFRIEDGVESNTPYYEGVVSEVVDLNPTDPFALVSARARSIALFRALQRTLGPLAPGGDVEAPDLESAETLSWTLASEIEIDPAWLHALLCLGREEERLQQIDQLLSKVIGMEGWNDADGR